FDEWLQARRAFYTVRMLAALQRMTGICLERGDYARAEWYARQQLALDAWEEPAHRQLMTALAKSGQRSAALAQFDLCRHLIQLEAGLALADETLALAEEIRTGRLDAEPAFAADPPAFTAPPLWSAQICVARERELQHLDHQLSLALSGNGRVAFVSGEAGSGKSTLLREFGRQAMERDNGLVVADAECSAFGGVGDPFLPIHELVALLTGNLSRRQRAGRIDPMQERRLQSLAPVARATLTALAPDLTGLSRPLDSVHQESGGSHHAESDAAQQVRAGATPAHSAGSDGASQDGAEPVSRYEQLATFFLALATRRPLLLLIDNLHWADHASIRLLFHLGKRLAGSRILIVGSFRAADIADLGHGARHPLATVVHELQREFGTVAVDLDQVDGRRFVDALLDSVPNRLDARFRNTIFRHTEGQALFTVETLRDLSERGVLVQNAQGWWIEAAPAVWNRLPPRIEAVIAEHIERLPGEWRALLEVASVEGLVFSAEVLAQVAHFDEGRVLHALSEPLRQQHHLVLPEAQLRVGPEGHRLSRYRFVHNLYQQYLYSRLDDSNRSFLHEEVGRAIEETYGPDAGEQSARLAWHFSEAGLPARAAEFHWQAANRAMGLLAHDEATVHCMQALLLLARLPAIPEHAALELEVRNVLAAALTLLCPRGGAEVARVLARALGESDGQGEGRESGSQQAHLLVETLMLVVGNCAASGKLQDMVAATEGFAQWVAEQQDPRLWAAAELALGQVYLLMADLEVARRHLEKAVALFEGAAGAAAAPGR
ncbi:MAG: ATP-binding protein, partial [Caldilineaceae bacterium]